MELSTIISYIWDDLSYIWDDRDNHDSQNFQTTAIVWAWKMFTRIMERHLDK